MTDDLAPNIHAQSRQMHPQDITATPLHTHKLDIAHLLEVDTMVRKITRDAHSFVLRKQRTLHLNGNVSTSATQGSDHNNNDSNNLKHITNWNTSENYNPDKPGIKET